MPDPPTIDHLLNLVPDNPSAVLSQLHAHPSLASRQDSHGYSLVHAAASYGQTALLDALIQTFHVDPNLTDEDDETALFSVEEVSMARHLLRLGTDRTRRNDAGQTAAEKLADEDEQPAVAAFLRGSDADADAAHPSGAPAATDLVNGTADTSADAVHPPPPLPPGVQIHMGTMSASDDPELHPPPEPEFRRRIEQLAAREDFADAAAQRELRSLVEDAVAGIRGEGSEAPPSTRRRVA